MLCLTVFLSLPMVFPWPRQIKLKWNKEEFDITIEEGSSVEAPPVLVQKFVAYGWYMVDIWLYNIWLVVVNNGWWSIQWWTEGAEERLGYPYSLYMSYSMRSHLELRMEFPNHLIDHINQRFFGRVLEWGVSQNVWWISWKIPSINGCFIGVPPFQETSIYALVN